MHGACGVVSDTGQHLAVGVSRCRYGVPEETAAAIEGVVVNSFGMNKSAIPATVLRLLLGFKRTTEAAQRLVIEVLEGMVTEERLAEKGTHASLKG